MSVMPKKEHAKAEKKINGWCFSPRDNEALTQIEIYHVAATATDTSTGRRVLRVTPEKLAELGNPTAVTAAILEACYDDAEEWGGFQKYIVVGKFGGGRIGDESFPLGITARDETDEDRALAAAPSEKATVGGNNALMMRHADNSARSGGIATRAALEILERENVRLVTRLNDVENRYRSREVEWLNERKTMIDMQIDLAKKLSDHTIEQESKRDRAEMWKEMFTYGKFVLPYVLDLVMGEKTGAAQSPLVMGLVQFTKTLKPEQFEAMCAPLDGPHRLFVNLLMKRGLDEADKMEGKYKGDRPLGSNDADDASKRANVVVTSVNGVSTGTGGA